MRRKILTSVMSVLLSMVGFGIAYGLTGYRNTFNSTYGAAAATLGQCVLCHPVGGGNNAGNQNNFSRDFASNGYSFAAIENLDSDGDGFTNIQEITALTFPGDAASHPVVDATAPTVTSFSVPATSASLTVTITAFAATDDTAVTGYLVTESATAPAANAAGWSAAAPGSYTFASEGSKTLFAWAKDAAGNVSGSSNANVVITLPQGADVIAPTVTAFTIPGGSNSLTVAISAFTATDNVAVTGYLVTESAAAPAASDPGWALAPPANRTFASEGTKTLYGWAKDAGGNVSASLSANVVVTLSSFEAPVALSPASGSGNVALNPVLQLSVSFPDTAGKTHKATNWQISSDAGFASGKIIFSSLNDSANLISLTVPPGTLMQGATYYWRAGTVNSANQASPYSAAASFTTVVVQMDAATGAVPDALAVKSGGTVITDLSTLSQAALAAAGNIPPRLVSGSSSVPLVNAGAGADTTKASMMIVKANGGVGLDVLGIVTPAGTVIDSVTTTTASDAAFTAPMPVGISLPYGAVSFRISGITPGSSVNVTMYTPTDLPSGAIWCKYSPAKGWLKIDSAGIYDASGAQVSTGTKFNVVDGRGVLTIKDGDLADLSAELVAGKAVIFDPGGPGLPSTVPLATGGGGSGGGCFIATAAFGSPINPYVKTLRDFRDTFLLTNAGGRKFVDFYYRVSPDIANKIAANESLKLAVRAILLPLIGLSFLALNIGMPALFLVLTLLLTMAGLLARRVYVRGRRA